ncbi:hypothetical protein ACNUDN_29430 [Mycobacterium sp. smrl_JER01]|uniref:Uncharacterized protein n=1 Tax=Mycolicibacterium gilvum (strain PYR-GCK) TaxID=350054 RepID=A4TFW3_MYCGI
MNRHPMRFIVAAVAAAVAALLVPIPASAGPAMMAYPGMAIAQGDSACAIGFIDTRRRIAYSAGHCATTQTVTDQAGRTIGVVALSEHNRAGHKRTGPRDSVIDYQVIALNSNIQATNQLGPNGTRPLITEPGVKPKPGMKVCQLGPATGSSCGTIEAVNDGWFTMAPGSMTSQHGDSGAPVYTYTTASGPKPVIVGILRGLNGGQVAAVSWPDTMMRAIYAAAEATA